MCKNYLNLFNYLLKSEEMSSEEKYSNFCVFS